ncbi:hypothetical protein Nos7524_4737 [Nostoc sp. PCC 7524]|uniref:hypothetical protein n=1 Tax=Nostoc sp. (strain ATCC 29411 / PCC 7524) TaxID=28072 RepID=UPI00029F18E7|nr:hypothetical protein [Nostoc sp. PCC 7524]AFY50479.1 hypothetical protein Nos7524_4737 [Nostoc sp. PCC 7524]
MRIWAATVVLTSSLVIAGVLHPSVLANNAKTPSQSISQPQSNKAQQINVTKAEFGFAKIDSQGKFNFTPTTRIPLEEGSKYGWRIQLQNVQGEVTWREVLRLPKPPETWATDNGENFKLSTDGSEAVSNRTQLAKDGVIENFWTITPGDPPGKHIIHVYVDDRLVGNFEFEVIPRQRQAPQERLSDKGQKLGI